MFVTRPFRLLASFLVFLILLPGTALAEEYHFITVYGAQKPFNQPRYTHTWATLVRLTGSGPDIRTYQAEKFTISWLPSTLEVRPFKLLRDPGRNLPLEETLAWCRQNDMEITQFGPYQIVPDLYNRMYHRWAHLEGGTVSYRAGDIFNLGVRGDVTNCIYAVLDFDGEDPAIRPLTLGYGFKASAFVARRLRPWMVDPSRTYPCVSARIGVENFPTVRVGLSAVVGNYPRVPARP